MGLSVSKELLQPPKNPWDMCTTLFPRLGCVWDK